MKVSTLLEKSSIRQLLNVFDYTPNVLFWIKDSESKFIYGNKKLLIHLGCKSLGELILKTDYDFTPPHLAAQFIEDDKQVMQGRIIIDRLELNQTEKTKLSWYSTSKQALLDDNGQVIGSVGVSHHINKRNGLPTITLLEIPINYIHANFSENLSLEKLSEISCISISALERRFKKHLGRTPSQYINEVRLREARRLVIETDIPISQIAFQCGFIDPSYFSKRFCKTYGKPPSKLRKKAKIWLSENTLLGK